MATQEEILARSEQLQERLRALGGQKPTPQQEQDMLRELLEIRILELSNTLPQKEAIEQAYNEQARYKALATSDESNKQFELLEKMKNELLQAQIQKEMQESPEERMKREEEEEAKKKKTEEDDKKKDNKGGNNPIEGGGSYSLSNDDPQAGASLTDHSQYQVASINTFSRSRCSLDPNNHTAPNVGKTSNSTTLDLGGIKATIYKSGVHREMKLELPPNPTDEQKEKFNAALQKHANYSGRGDYNLLTHNCVGAVAETLNSLAPEKFNANTRMPWSLDSQIQNELNQQLQQNQEAQRENTQSIGQQIQQWINDAKNSLTNSFKQTPSPDQDQKVEMSRKNPSLDEKKEPGKADGKNITDANGEKQDVKKAEQEKTEQQKQEATAAVPTPPTPSQPSS